jgi:Rrf2 family protein
MISKTALHGVNALVRLVGLESDEYLGATVLAEQINAPPNYLGKLLASLSAEGLLESRKGSGGGFRLARPADEISIFDVVDPVDKVSRWDHCFMGLPECSEEEPCAMHDRWKVVRDDYLAMLRDTSLLDLVGTSD